MMRPVGAQSSSVYWRRRLVLLGSAVVVLLLIVLTIRTATSGGGKAGAAPAPKASDSGSTAPAATRASTAVPSSSVAVSSSKAAAPAATGAGKSKASGSASSSAPPAACRAGNLKLAAVSAKPSYKVGTHPTLELQVTNAGKAPCVQNLGDEQIELRVYNGESRVWGSKDCQVQPGKFERTLAVDQPVRVSVVWLGLSSQPKCAGTRQKVGPGTYTLYVSLAGHAGKATQFTLT